MYEIVFAFVYEVGFGRPTGCIQYIREKVSLRNYIDVQLKIFPWGSKPGANATKRLWCLAACGLLYINNGIGKNVVIKTSIVDESFWLEKKNVLDWNLEFSTRKFNFDWHWTAKDFEIHFRSYQMHTH